jgi:hypothetical protein
MQAIVRKPLLAAFLAVFVLVSALSAVAQAGGNSSSVVGTVADPTGAVVPRAVVEIHNPVSGFSRKVTTDVSGTFSIPNVPFNNYHLTATAAGFAPYVQDIALHSTIPVSLPIHLEVASSNTSVTVEASAEDLLENTPTFHTDVDRDLIEKVPLESASSSVSSLVTLSSPGVAADSNGLFHGLGDHAENSFSVDGQPITDQQSKVFSNQIPLDSIQSTEVISGAPPAEYGGKTSLVIDVTTRSGQGVTTPHGGISTEYGSFGSPSLDFNLSYGGKRWGNFIAASGMQTGRFLDPPEHTVFHDKGNEENVFDRVDYQLSAKDSLQFNLGYSRSWFQTPNTFDSQYATPWNGLDGVLPAIENYGGIAPNGQTVGVSDQRSKIGTFNIAPTWTRLINNQTAFTMGAFVRRDGYNYYHSDDPFADLGAPSLQRQSVGQDRTLTNAGLRSTLSYVKGMHNIKAGVTYEQTYLNEGDSLGIVDPAFNAPCIAFATDTGNYVAAPGFTDPSQCVGAYQPNTSANSNAPNSSMYPVYNSALLPYDLTRGGTPYAFNDHTDVKVMGMYVQDAITKGNWSFNLGIRGDLYNGLTTAQQAEPRLGAAYNIKKTNSILRLSYARTMETPFNENLILSSLGCSNAVLNPLLGCFSSDLTPLAPGRRDEFHAGLQQAFGRYVVFSGEYIWKYTHNAYDFSVLGNTPITFPIEWKKSKIPGVMGRVGIENYHGLTAFTVFSSVAARFFLPQVGGAGATPLAPSGVFRIDHDEKFNQTTHVQYQPWKKGPWMGFNWRFDSGLVAGNAPCYGASASNTCPQSTTQNGQPAILMEDVSGHPLSADLEFEAGFACNGLRATPTQPLPSACLASQFTSNLIQIPAPGTENDDHKPPRIQQRSLFDLALGADNIFQGDKFKLSAQVTIINLANNYALYNFLSTFSGTHYVTPRAVTAQIGFHF